jgi:sugar O-acyltransferase (sialic acid O-acetyltransferase NeuD family)
MRHILIISGGDFAAKVIRLINRIGGYVIVGYTDIVDRGSLFGVKHLGADSQIPDLIRKHPELNAVLCVGVNEEHRDKRKLLINYLNKYEIQIPTLIAPNAFIEEDVEIGSGSIVFDNALIDFGVTIGNYSVVNLKATVCHNTEISDDVTLSPSSVIAGGCKIGSGTFVGTNATINPYISITSGCVIGSGSVVVKDCLVEGVYFGNPAKLVGSRK